MKYPCRNCIYFKTCGDNMRTVECKGRTTKSEKKKMSKLDDENGLSRIKTAWYYETTKNTTREAQSNGRKDPGNTETD